MAFVVASYLAFHEARTELRQLQTEIASLNKSAQISYTHPGPTDPPWNGKSPGMRLNFTNTGALPSIGLIFQHRFRVYDHPLTNIDQSKEMEDMRKIADKDRSTLTDQEQSPNIPFSLVADDPDDTLIVKKDGSAETYYMFAVLEYKDRMLPPEEWWITEVCLEMSKKGTFKCPSHNKIFRSK